MAVVSGVCVDMYSQGQEFKNYTPGFIMSIICFFIDIFIISKIEVSKQFLNLFSIRIENETFIRLTSN